MMIQQDFGSIYNNDYLPRSEAAVLGAKNLLYSSLGKLKTLNPYPSSASGTWSDNTYTESGITCVYNDNGSVTISGTATATVSFNFFIDSAEHFYNKFPYDDLILTGCPKDGDNDTYRLDIYSSLSSYEFLIDTGNGVTIPKDWASQFSVPIFIRIRIASGYAFSSPKIFYPMIRLASDPDSSYALPAITNRELSNAVSFSKIQYGTVSLGTLSQGLNNIDITFNEPFRTGRNIVVTANIHGPYSPINEVTGPSIVSVSNSGFRVRINNSYTGTASITPSLDYIAIS